MLFAMLIVSVRQFAIAGDAMDHMQAKYVDPSLFCDVSNLDFQLELLALLYSVILWITLFIGFGLFAPSEDAFAARRRGTVVFARCFSAVLLTLVLAGAKFCILPHGSLSAVDTTSLQVIAHTQSRDIEASDATVSLLRKTGYRAEKPVYQSTTVTLSYGNTGLLTFRRTVNAGNGALHRLEIPEVEAAYRYDYDAIAYVRHGTAFALESDRIADYPYEDACLIAVCENLIQRQCFQALEFSYPYLLKYDRDFLLSYLETLRDDAMRDRYYAYNPEIRPEYIKQFLDEIS